MTLTPEIFATLVFTGLCVGMGLTLLGLVRLVTHWLKTNRHKKGKYETYECGAPKSGDSRERFGVRFYLIALFFVLFDIETVFLLPYAVAYKKLGLEGLLEVLIFVAVLGVGLLYLIRRGALEWE